jgi:hypothetical protein
MRFAITLTAAALAAALAACSSAPPTPVPLVGGVADIAALTGQWEGSYSSVATGRSGSISFTLTAQRDSAYGDVVMIPRGFGRPLQAWDRPAPAAGPEQPRSQVLTINFVRIAGGRVSGTLAPYADPETGLRLFTTFEGRLSGDTITGTFMTRGPGSTGGQTGEWQVTRKR